jgi:hypothetical protein
MHPTEHIHFPPAARPWGAELASFHLGAAGQHGARRVCIETARAEHHHLGANRLLQQRYSWRGYRPVSLPGATGAGVSEHLPLTASRDGTVIGTLTVGFDNAGGLNCDASFGQEVQALRAEGQRLCEFTKLAVQAGEASARVLAALFHVAFLAARKLYRVDQVLLEVNPRHVRYYQRVLGAEVLGQARNNARVDAPAVLLALPSTHIRQQLDDAVWPERRPAASRSLYTQAFNRAEESAVVARLTAQLGRLRAGEHAPAFAFRLPEAPSNQALPAA